MYAHPSVTAVHQRRVESFARSVRRQGSWETRSTHDEKRRGVTEMIQFAVPRIHTTYPSDALSPFPSHAHPSLPKCSSLFHIPSKSRPRRKKPREQKKKKRKRVSRAQTTRRETCIRKLLTRKGAPTAPQPSEQRPYAPSRAQEAKNSTNPCHICSPKRRNAPHPVQNQRVRFAASPTSAARVSARPSRIFSREVASR